MNVQVINVMVFEHFILFDIMVFTESRKRNNN